VAAIHDITRKAHSELMGETEESPTNNEPTAELKNRSEKTARLLDAGLLVFLATAFSLCMSTLYVSGLSWALGFLIQSYFGLQDYLQVTTYWLGPVLGLALVWGMQWLPQIINFFRITRRDPGQKWLPWFLSNYAYYLVLGGGIVVLSSLGDWNLGLSGALVAGYLWLGYIVARRLTDSVSEKIGDRRIVRLSILIGLPIAAFALSLGWVWTPAFLLHEKVSEIYFSDAHSEAKPVPLKGKILFALTQYLIVRRDDDVYVTVPVGRIERIETPRDQPSATSTQRPSAIPAASIKQTPVPTATVAPSVTAVIPTASTSPK
jgi:hypothetical protein